VQVRLRLPRCDLCGREEEGGIGAGCGHACGAAYVETVGVVLQRTPRLISPYCVSPPTISLPGTNVHGTDEEEKVEDRDGWETILMDGRTIDIRASAIREKCQRTRRSLYIAQFLVTTMHEEGRPCLVHAVTR